MKVYKISYDGSFYFENDLNNLFNMLVDSDVNNEYVVTVVDMDKDKYDNLPEFYGF